MYAALWRALPGGRFAKTLQALVLALAVITALFLWFFPAVTPHLPFEEVTIENPSGTATEATTTP